MENMTVENYFEKKSKDYDAQIQKPFWHLCDEIIWEYLLEIIKKINKSDLSIVDIGGGTGYWAEKIKNHFPESKITIIEKSKSMQLTAKNKLKDYVNVKVIQGDVLHIDLDEKFDLCICIYVSMFIKEQSILFNKLSNYCNDKGEIFFVGQNINHTLAMLVSNNQVTDALNLLESGYAKIKEDLPILYLLSRNDIYSLTKDYGMAISNLATFPKFCRPGIRDKMTSFEHSISDVLRDKNNFELLKVLEYKKLWTENMDSGMYWLLHAKKGDI